MMTPIRVRTAARNPVRWARQSPKERPGHAVAHRAASRPVARRIHGRRSRASVFAPAFVAARELIRWHKILFPPSRWTPPVFDEKQFRADLDRIYGDGSPFGGDSSPCPFACPSKTPGME
jgi:hypothetical protein